MTTPDFSVLRVRHPLKLRRVQVVRTQPVSRHLLRVTLAGEDLADFTSASFDDHVKVFFPAPGTLEPVLPQLGSNGVVASEGQRPIARDYTPRRFDLAARELDLEFVLHGDGVASSWAAQAKPGQALGVGGPRGSTIIPLAFDWHLLVGDEAALPAIARRLEELPSAARAFVFVELTDRASQIELSSAARFETQWLVRDPAGESPLVDAVRKFALPDGEGFAWSAGESNAIRAVRDVLRKERGLGQSRVRASGYWKRGSSAVHDHLDD